MSWLQWHGQLSTFLHETCKRWDLPFPEARHTADGNDEPPPKRLRASMGANNEKLTFRGEVPAADELMDTVAPAIDWGCPDHCFIHVTESQVLQGIVCGHMRLHDSSYEPLIARILELVAGH